ncbi:molybdopterin-dependent oxidoreductase [Caenispirillum bisanense]|uniref:Oxidoreductase molybdopterin-binding domain-containing protein n=1 Tax=Caenispirillum bisanense TaxID=414052 RepID=A0A286GRN3_9PROT|nr:molybdopterin-dependent oxidoreductase [Caenispirillum bisanense]SOD98152.1 hypothetical protein SAMN05421508_107218 [Caenispirillum bisanense]
MRSAVFALMVLIGVAAAALPSAPSSAAGPLPQPSGAPLLTVDGAIDATNRDGKAVFDRAMLERLGMHALRTGTTWTDGVNTFEGVLARDVMAAVGARGDTVIAIAINDYRIDIPVSDFSDYDVLFALRMDGKDLTARDKGPLWIVYPRDDHAELQDGRRDHRWVWQLNALRVE